MSIKNLGINLYRGTKNAWRKYHFLVPPKMWKKYAKLIWGMLREGKGGPFWNPDNVEEYNAWLVANEKEEKPVKLEYRPLISVLIPVYNVKGEFLKECIESVLTQSYRNFEICIVDDASDNEETLGILKEYEKNKKIRIKHRKENGHISRVSNDALDMAKGEFVALLDNDDLLAKNALYEVVKVLNENKKLDLIYSDEDKIGLDGKRCYPHFKPDYSPDTIFSLNYICHLTVIRTTLAKRVNGFTVGLEGAQDHDLILKVLEKTNRVCHVPKILYHWRMIPGSTSLKLGNKDYAGDNGQKTIEAALKRRKLKAHVEKDLKSTYYRVIYEFEKEPMVSILIPTKDHVEVTKKCLDSVYTKTNYRNFEVILIDNGSVEKETLKLFEEYKKKYKNFRVLREDIEFNYSKLNNLAVKKAKGDYLVLLNNDTEIITENWLGVLVGYAMQPHVGAVGPKLLYPDETVQHAGVILGLGGVASHAYIGANRNELGMYGRLRVPYNYAAVTGACLCVSKKKFEEVGGLEEDLKVAYNDVDFCLKLLKAGYYNVEIPMVEVYHYESKSRGSDLDADKIDRFNAEQDYMWEKWGDILSEDRFYNVNFANGMWFLLGRKGRKDYDRRKK